MALVDFSSFVLGLLTPLTAVCVLPLYPAFLAYIANQFSSEERNKKIYALFGATITLGVIVFMLLLGLIFTTIFQISLTKIIGIISPIAFSILGIVSILLLFDFDISRFIPKPKTPTSKNPKLNAFLYGFFFGAIVIPCNPAFIAAFFARALIIDNFFSSMINFLLFGLGLGFPLLIFSLLSSKWNDKIIGFAVQHKSAINRLAGILMLGISLYYLIFVFRIFG
ncbi:sulfite exporter TauE/SafE family protein [Candidatus Woesearchaeota archaeon]|nr:sulfite exporter TauE/SafE family protein [Candidatus Woesearchaeota archaeon]